MTSSYTSASNAPMVSYVGQRIALLTQHGKEAVIAPVLEPALGCKIERVAGYDTDLLGTFTREIERAGTQLEAARKKARIGMEFAGLPIGVASEGAFGPDPFTAMLSWNVELLIFIDDGRGLEITGVAHAAANFDHQLVSDLAGAEAFARKAGFPEHHLVVRPQGEDDQRIRKGIATWSALEDAFAVALSQSTNGRVFLETDVRAHANPTRMDNIRLAAVDLVRKISSLCPACGIPGFWIVERVEGLPCAQCSAPTRETRAEIHGCIKCSYRITRDCPGKPAVDPSRCNYCNP